MSQKAEKSTSVRVFAQLLNRSLKMLRFVVRLTANTIGIHPPGFSFSLILNKEKDQKV